MKRPDGASGQIIDLDNEEYKTFIFPETVFTAVTAYQNQLVSYIKFITNEIKFVGNNTERTRKLKSIISLNSP